MTLEGVVLDVAGDTFAVEGDVGGGTGGGGGAGPMKTVFRVSGTDLSVSIPDGTFVQVGMDCNVSQMPGTWHVIVRNLPVWGGTPNPTSDGTFLWLAFHDGFDSPYTLPDDPYQTERELACKGTSDDSRNVYTWRFSFPDAPGAEVVAPQGQTVTWSVPAGEHAGQYRVRNVKADEWFHREDNFWIARQ